MESVESRIEENVCHIELENSEGGFLTSNIVKELDRITSECEKNPEVRVIVITGKVPGTFMTHYSPYELNNNQSFTENIPAFAITILQKAAGILLRGHRVLEMVPMVEEQVDKLLANKDLEVVSTLNLIHKVFTRMQMMPKPVIAAINGSAMGGGCELCLACDYRIMARGNYSIGLPETICGIIPGAGGTQRLARLVGADKALELMLDGILCNADEAEKIGLISRAVDEKELETEVRHLAERLATRAPIAVAATKRAIRLGKDIPITDALNFEIMGFLESVMSRDAGKSGKYFIEQYNKGESPQQIFEAFREGLAVKFTGK